MISVPPFKKSFPDSKSKCSQSLFPTAIPMCPGSGNFDCSSWYYSAIGNAMRKGSKRIEVEKGERKAMARKKNLSPISPSSVFTDASANFIFFYLFTFRSLLLFKKL
jgi:hypothetical protein